MGSIIDFGVDSSALANQCLTNEVNRACRPNNPVYQSNILDAVGGTEYILEINTSEIYLPGTGEGCITPESTIFVQYTCEMGALDYLTKFEMLSLFSCLAIFIAITSSALFRYMRQNDKLEYLEWDFDTTTAADYTLMLRITPEQYKQWKNDYARRDLPFGVTKKDPLGYAFKEDLKNTIEGHICEHHRSTIGP